jgi:hypothetical protein
VFKWLRHFFFPTPESEIDLINEKVKNSEPITRFEFHAYVDKKYDNEIQNIRIYIAIISADRAYLQGKGITQAHQSKHEIIDKFKKMYDLEQYVESVYINEPHTEGLVFRKYKDF